MLGIVLRALPVVISSNLLTNLQNVSSFIIEEWKLHEMKSLAHDPVVFAPDLFDLKASD